MLRHLRGLTTGLLVSSSALGLLGFACSKDEKPAEPGTEIDPERSDAAGKALDASNDTNNVIEELDAGVLPPADSGKTSCDPFAPFERIERPSGVPTPFTVRPTADERTVYFGTFRFVSLFDFRFELSSASRPDTTVGFAGAAPLGGEGMNTGSEAVPFITSDGLTLFFTSRRSVDGGPGGENIWVATRASTFADFAKPSLVTGVNSSDNDTAPYYVEATGELFFASVRTGRPNLDLYRAVKTGGGFAPPERIAELDGPGDETLPVLSKDGLTLYYSGGVDEGDGGINRDIFVTTRSKVGAPFGPRKRVDALSTSEFEVPSWISADGCRFWFHGIRDGGTQNPIVAVRVPR